MNTFVTALTRDLTCAAAAAVISLVVALGFVQSTTVVRTSAQAVASAAQSSTSHKA